MNPIPTSSERGGAKRVGGWCLFPQQGSSLALIPLTCLTVRRDCTSCSSSSSSSSPQTFHAHPPPLSPPDTPAHPTSQSTASTIPHLQSSEVIIRPNIHNLRYFSNNSVADGTARMALSPSAKSRDTSTPSQIECIQLPDKKQNGICAAGSRGQEGRMVCLRADGL